MRPMIALVALLLDAVTTLGLLVAAEATEAADTWRPADHPAQVVHRIDALTRPRAELLLAAEVGGRIDTLDAEVGAVIGADAEGVIQLDASLATIAHERAAAALREAETALAVAEAERARRERAAAYQASELERIQALLADGRLTEREGEAQRFAADDARLTVEVHTARVRARQAAVESARAALREAREHLDRHRIAAPAGWRVSERLAEPGSVVAAGEPILHLHDLRELEIHVHLTAAEIAALEAEDALQLRFPDADLQARAHLDHIDVRAHPQTRKRRVTLVVPGDGAPAPSGGLKVELALEVPLADGGVLVPERFLLRRQRRVFVELTGGERVPVVPLRERGGLVVIDDRALPADAVLALPERDS